jgi:hypothetical protein
MSLPATLNQSILNTILSHLALLFLAAAGDPDKARLAAVEALSGYNIQTEEELRLAAEIIAFGFHALQALAQAAEAGLSPNRTLRLRGSAVSLSRQAHKAQRKLDQLQRAPRRAEPQPKAADAPAEPQAANQPATNEEMARAFAEAERVAKQIIAGDGVKRWSQAGQKRAMALRMAEKARQNAARHAATHNAAAQNAVPAG